MLRDPERRTVVVRPRNEASAIVVAIIFCKAARQPTVPSIYVHLVCVPNALDYKARPCQWCLVISTNFLKLLLLDQLLPRYGRYLNKPCPPMRASLLRSYRSENFKTLIIPGMEETG